MTSYTRAKPVKTNSDTNLSQYMKQKKGHTKPKQFSAKSRSKSNTSFKNLQKLHRVGSHDALNKGLLDPVRKSKSSDSLNRRTFHSGLSMTALVRTTSHPVVLHQNGQGAKQKGLMGDRSTKSILLDLHDSGDNDSVTDEEVECFTDLDGEDGLEEEHLNGMAKNSSYQRNSHQSINDFQERNGLSVDSGRHFQRPLSYKPPSRLRNRVDADDDHISPKHRNTTDNDKIDANLQEDDLIDPNNQDNVSNTNSLRRHGQHIFGFTNGSAGQQENYRRTSEEHDDIIEPRTSHNGGGLHYNAEDDIDAVGRQDSNSTKNSSNVSRNENKDSVLQGKATDGEQHLDRSPIEISKSSDSKNNIRDEDNSALNGSNVDGETQGTEQYVPDIILSQSTGMERRFDQLSRQSSLAWLNPAEANNEKSVKIQNTKSNKFNYINQDLAASLKDDNIEQSSPPRHQEPQQKPSKVDFSTSISSLTSHLARPVSRDHLLRATPVSQSRPWQHSLYRQPSYGENDTSNNGMTDFSSFLQYGDVGTDSRTQQKLWLQRENSIQDLTSQNPSADSVFLASNVEVRREFERISREYTNVRRFSNPLAESLSRISQQQNIDIQKQKKFNTGESTGNFLGGDYNKNKPSKDGVSTGKKLEIQRTLTKLWNTNTLEFNKDENPLIQANPELLAAQNAGSYRNSRPSRMSNSQHQRAVNSLHPTTRAVNRRMENVLSQQHA
ncbi:unnamed protein product [Kluyveromyces dobzhanskii CBS 2104]|uniref:WGS project CCBQ000000000 data, contig 00008 n=1 Tax=Kluyveromyces dobzhanskii CBS 2104 TaxID=1427455 RepID=A0A0A8L787_9SACH|nr:unnamed protein product [Kluyveromyces dobzhanskii CBS 2104]